MGGHRWRFLWQSLMVLECNLRQLAQRVHIAYGEPETLTALPPPPGFPEDNRGDCPPIPEPQHPVVFSGGEAAGLALRCGMVRRTTDRL